MKIISRLLLHAASLTMAFTAIGRAEVIVSGSATFTLNEGVAASIGEFDALFGATTSRANTLSLAAPGNFSFTEGATVQYVDPIRPFGEVPLTGDGRTRQITNLNFDPSNILGSWAPSTDNFGTFVSLDTGEQIALSLMTRWTGPFTGALLYGDFALRYVPARAGTTTSGGTLSGLVITSNIDFLNSSWADVANASITYADSTLNISGDLLVSGALNVLDPSAIPGTRFGSINVVAAVPEPSTATLLIAAGAGFASLRRRSRASR